MSRQFGALSGMAMVLIVLNHSIELGIVLPQQWGYSVIQGWGRTFLSVLQVLGIFAVPTFLFISGSFAAYAAQGDPPRLSRKFVYSTIKHILIPYIIWSFIFYLLVYFERGEIYQPWGYIKNILVGYPYHFIPLLIFYYIISPLLIWIGRSYGMLLIALIALYQLFLVNVLHPGTLGITFPAWAYNLTPPILRGTLADWGVYFPLGLVVGLRTRQYLPWLKRFLWVFGLLTVMLFAFGVLHWIGMLHAPLALYLCPVTFVLLIPAIKRDSIPFVRQLERIGRRSYGIYLAHLIVLNLILIGISLLVPVLFNVYIILLPLLFVVGLLMPLLVMEWMATSSAKQYYRYVFG